MPDQRSPLVSDPGPTSGTPQGQAAPTRALPHHRPTEIPKIQRHDRLGGLLHEDQQAA
jgi:hypothetical protein